MQSGLHLIPSCSSHPAPAPSSLPRCCCSYTLLHLVCGLGLGASTALLLGPKAKADPNEASNTEALTPLHAAAMAGSLECVELLLSNGERAAT